MLGIYPLLSFLTSTLFWVTIMFLLWIPVCLPAGLHTATFTFLQLLLSPQPEPSFESLDIMHLIMPLLCLKSYNGFSALWGLNKKQTFHISYRARQMLWSPLTPLCTLSSSRTSVGSFAEIFMYQGLYTNFLLHQESTCHPPQSLHLIQTHSFFYLVSPVRLGFSSLFFSLVMPWASPP